MEEQLVLPATLPADRGQKQLVLAVALLVPIPFIAILPVGQIQLPRLDSYIPVVDTMILINDSITATLLFAMDATTDRRRELRLATQRRDLDGVVMTVQDAGPGIDPKRLDNIFDAFFTTKEHGMGLGLAICRVIAERHGGQLLGSSDGRNGARFQLVLPIKLKDPERGGVAAQGEFQR